MPDPQVRYCTTQDGVRIAYTVTGAGPPHILVADPIASHVQLEWEVPLFKRLFGPLASNNTLIRFDARGGGMSDRVFPMTLEESALDIQAVVERLQLDHFALTCFQFSTPAVVLYAAQNATRIRRIVFLDSFLRMRDLLDTPQARALMSAASIDFEMATEALGAVSFGPGREESRAHGIYVRSCVGPEFFAQAPVTATFDATPYASSLRMPALAIRHEGLQYVTPEMTRDLVSRLPDARLFTVPGLWADDPEGLADHIRTFINEDIDAPRTKESEGPSGVRTVLFTDIVGHTEMMQRLGDEQGRALLREHERITRELLTQYSGTEVKTMGDGFMASFGSVTKAVECAIALQRAFAEREGKALNVRVGLNAGEPIEEDGDLFGATVILASRIAAKAGGGEILVADTVRGLCSGKGFLFADRGEFVAKGFEEPVRVCEVSWRHA